MNRMVYSCTLQDQPIGAVMIRSMFSIFQDNLDRDKLEEDLDFRRCLCLRELEPEDLEEWPIELLNDGDLLCRRQTTLTISTSESVRETDDRLIGEECS